MRALLTRLLSLGRSRADAAALLGDLQEELNERERLGRGRVGARVWYAREVIAATARGIGERLSQRPRLGTIHVARGHAMNRNARLSTLPEQLTREFALAWRRIRSAPGPTVFAIVTLALAIGVTVATYSLVYSALWRPLGVADEGRLILLARSNQPRVRSSRVSWADYQAIDRERASFAGVAAWAPLNSVLSAAGSAELIRGEFVTGSYFSMLGVDAVAGRMLWPDDDVDGAAPVVVLAYATWRDQFDADPAILGKTVKIGLQPFEVVGIAPAGFRGVHPDGLEIRSAWVPMEHAPMATPPSVAVAFRLKANQTLRDAADALTAVGERLDASTPLPSIRVRGADPIPARRWWTVVPTEEDLTLHDEDEVGRLIVGLPALVLLIACTNLANLVLSRGTVRRQEFGVRRALGAPRWRLIREQLVEQAAIVIAGGVAGVLVAHGLVGVARRVAGEVLAPLLGGGVTLDWSLDAGVLASTAVAVLLAIFVAGVLPALHLTRDSLRSVMDQGGASATPRWRGRGNLVALQVGVSVGLFLVAVVFIRMLLDNPVLRHERNAVAPGLDRIAVAFVPFERQERDAAETSDGVRRILDELRQTPDVLTAAATSDLTVFRTRGNYFQATAAPADAPQEADRGVMEFVAATPDIFRVLDIPLRAGRAFDDRDTADAIPVAIVNEGLARALFGTADVVGRQMRVRVDPRVTPGDKTSTMTIAGVLPGTEIVSRSGKRSSTTALYVPLAQQHAENLSFIARAVDGEAAPVATLRAAIKRADPELAVAYASRGDVLAEGPLAFLGHIATVLVALAVLALALSMTGLYGVLSHVFARRTREMGIRMALGAGRPRIVRLVLKDGFRPIVEGLFIGLATATVIRVYLKGALRNDEVVPLDPVACVAAAVLVAAAGALACYLPARRAAAVDPNVALRNL